MVFSIDGDTERSFARADFRRQQRFLVPIAVLFLAIAVQPFKGVASLTREVSSYIGVLAGIGLVTAHFVAADGSPIPYGRHAKWVIRAAAHLLCLRYDDAAHGALLKLLSIVVLPLSGARDADGVIFNMYLAVHFVVSCLQVGGNLADEGWQWLLILLISDTLFWDVSEAMNDQREMQALLNSTSQVVQSLLGTICDGCLLLGDDGTLAGSDQKAANLLGLTLAERAPGASFMPTSTGAPRIGSVLEDFLEGGKLIRGLRMLRLPTASEERLQVEAYIIPFPMAPKDALVLGLHMPAPLAGTGRVHLCAFRLADGGFEPKATPNAGGPPSIRSLKVKSLDISQQPMAIQGSQAGSRDRHGFIRSEGSTVDSGLMSPRTQAASVLQGPGPSPAHPGIPLQSIQAVGLGVGSYTKVRVVGKGAQGQVWQVTSQDGTTYAQKEIALKGQLWHRDFPKRLRDADREVRALKGLAWASCVVVPIVDCWIQKDFEQSCIVMEWLPKTLDGVLKKRVAEGSGPVPLPTACNWLARLAAGLGAIHAAGFIHRDLKPSNILLDESLQQCKITDLGVSRALHRQGPKLEASERQKEHGSGSSAVSGTARSEAPEEKYSMLSENVGSVLSGYTVRPGTIAYTSPEARETSHYGCEADIFSLAVVLLEVLTLEMPPEPGLGEATDGSAMLKRTKKMLADLPSGADPSLWAELRRLCIWMSQSRPEDRPSARELCMARILLPTIEQLVQHCPKLRVVLLQNAPTSAM